MEAGNGRGETRSPLLVPHIVVDHISFVDPDFLLRIGKRCALIDLDNTLLAWGAEELDAQVCAWVQGALAAGIRICVLSNSRSYRVAWYALQLGVPYVGVALKPGRAAARGAMQLIGSCVEDTVIIGDQIFTDILLGRRLGLYTILVRPMAMREQFWMRMVRVVERLFWPAPEGEESVTMGRARIFLRALLAPKRKEASTVSSGQ